MNTVVCRISKKPNVKVSELFCKHKLSEIFLYSFLFNGLECEDNLNQLK